MTHAACHRIWFQGASQVPQQARARMATFQAQNPEFRQIIWCKRSMQAMVSACCYPLLARAYAACAYMHQHIDLFKYALMYYVGGAYVDMDVEPVRPVRQFLLAHGYPRVSIISRLNVENALEAWLSCGTARKADCVNNGIFFGVAGSEFWAYILRGACEAVLRAAHKRVVVPAVHISRTTGPVFFSRAVSRWAARDTSLCVVDARYMEPYKIFEERDITREQDAVLIHVYELSWLPRAQMPALRIVVRHYKLLITLIVAAVCARLILKKFACTSKKKLSGATLRAPESADRT